MRNMFLVLLVVCLPTHSQSKHLLCWLIFCQRNLSSDAQYDLEYDGDELLYVDPVTYAIVQRLPEFAEQWTPDPQLPGDTYVSIGTCLYNIPTCIKGEKNPPEAIVPPTTQMYPREQVELGVQNTLICWVSDFHPTPVSITWSRNGQTVGQGDVSQTQYYSNKDFSFRIFSYLSFTPQEGDIYSCTVEHISLFEPLTRFWEVEVHTDHQVMETAVCVCGVLLGVMGVAVGVWFIRKANGSLSLL